MSELEATEFQEKKMRGEIDEMALKADRLERRLPSRKFRVKVQPFLSQRILEEVTSQNQSPSFKQCA